MSNWKQSYEIVPGTCPAIETVILTDLHNKLKWLLIEQRIPYTPALDRAIFHLLVDAQADIKERVSTPFRTALVEALGKQQADANGME